MRRCQLIVIIVLALLYAYEMGYNNAVVELGTDDNLDYMDQTVSTEIPIYEF